MDKKIAAGLGVPMNGLYGLVIADGDELQGSANVHFTPAVRSSWVSRSPRGFWNPSANSRVLKKRRHT